MAMSKINVYLWIFLICLQILSSVVLTSGSDGEGMCNIRNRQYLKPEHFQLETQMLCFRYTLPLGKVREDLLKIQIFFYANTVCTKNITGTVECTLIDYTNSSNLIFQAFTSPFYANGWADCCRRAMECCDLMLSTPPVEKGAKLCPRTWDGVSCFPDTKPNEKVENLCPSIIAPSEGDYHCQRYSVRQCTSNGTWFVNSTTKQDYTDYNLCTIQDEELNVYYFAVAVLAVSVISLIPVLVIFSIYEQLKVHRITLHKNLSIAVMLTAIFYIIEHSLYSIDGRQKYTTNNEWWCKGLTVLRQYFWFSQYTWMLCEGFYLHRIIAAAFSKQKKLYLYSVFGWGFPALLVAIYATLKICKDDRRCLRPVTSYEHILNIPAIIFLLINLGFLCHVVYVLVTKLQKTNSSDTDHIRKVARAVLLLIPVFGVHFIIMLFIKPASCSNYAKVQYINWALIGFQGLFVALVFCYFNGEVHYLLKRSYLRYQDKSDLSIRRRSTRTSVMIYSETTPSEEVKEKDKF